MGKEGPETQYRKKAVAFGSTLLAGSVFTGPAAPIVALAGAACLVGTGLRHLLNRRARENYNTEHRRGEEDEDSGSSRGSFYPESPETAMARRDPSGTARLLRQMSRDRVTMSALETASVITHDYLSYIPPERLAQSNGIIVSFERKRNLYGILTGKDTGFDLDVDLK